MRGKIYLAELTKENFPVIPTITNLSEIDKLPAQQKYIIKPFFGGDSWGLETLEKDDLISRDITGYVVQPFVTMVKETHFVFIDNEFIYAFSAQSRRDTPMPDDIGYCQPSAKEVEFAKQFVDWNNIDNGLQRVDVVETADGRLLLNELEDHCPYMWLYAMPEEVQQEFIMKLKASISLWLTTF